MDLSPYAPQHPTGENKPPSVVQRTNVLPYIVALVTTMAAGVISVLGITIARPADDNSTLIVLVLGFITTTAASVFALMRSGDAVSQAKDTHLSVNSRLDQLLVSAGREGRSEGVAAERARADAVGTPIATAVVVSDPVTPISSAAIAAALERMTKDQESMSRILAALTEQRGAPSIVPVAIVSVPGGTAGGMAGN
jgi:hypothetical protein